MNVLHSYFFGPGPIIWIQHLVPAFWVPVLALLSAMGTVYAIPPLLAWAFWHRGWRLMFALLELMGIAMGVKSLVAFLIPVSRPDDPRIVIYEHIGFNSFPSGHLVTAVTLWGLMDAARLIPSAIVAVLILVISGARLVLGAHYLGDVIGGIVLGLVALLLFLRYWHVLTDWWVRRPWGFWLAVGIVCIIGAVVAYPHVLTMLTGKEIMGTVAGLGIALPVERRTLRYLPDPVASRRHRGLLLLGLGGVLLPMLIAAWLSGGGTNPPPLAGPLVFLLYALAVLLALVGGPILWLRLGLGNHGPLRTSHRDEPSPDTSAVPPSASPTPQQRAA